MNDISAAFLGSNYFEDEGDEWLPVTAAVVVGLKSRGVRVTGEDVRRQVRVLEIETRKIDGKICARDHDISALVDLFHGKAKRSGARQPVRA